MKVLLNRAQRNALSWYFDARNVEGEPWPFNEPLDIEVNAMGELILNGCYLHQNGEWATFAEEGLDEV